MQSLFQFPTQAKNQLRFLKNSAKSLFLVFAAPSAIFVGIETAACCIGDIKPNRSWLGMNLSVDKFQLTNSLI